MFTWLARRFGYTKFLEEQERILKQEVTLHKQFRKRGESDLKAAYEEQKRKWNRRKESEIANIEIKNATLLQAKDELIAALTEQMKWWRTRYVDFEDSVMLDKKMVPASAPIPGIQTIDAPYGTFTPEAEGKISRAVQDLKDLWNNDDPIELQERIDDLGFTAKPGDKEAIRRFNLWVTQQAEPIEPPAVTGDIEYVTEEAPN